MKDSIKVLLFCFVCIILISGILFGFMSCDREDNLAMLLAKLTPAVQVNLRSEAQAVFADFAVHASSNEFDYVIEASMAPTIMSMGDAYMLPASLDGCPRHIKIKVGKHGKGGFVEIFQSGDVLPINMPSTCVVLSSNLCVYPE